MTHVNVINFNGWINFLFQLVNIWTDALSQARFEHKVDRASLNLLFKLVNIPTGAKNMKPRLSCALSNRCFEHGTLLNFLFMLLNNEPTLNMKPHLTYANRRFKHQTSLYFLFKLVSLSVLSQVGPRQEQKCHHQQCADWIRFNPSVIWRHRTGKSLRMDNNNFIVPEKF